MTSKVLKKEGDNIRNNLESMKQIGINKMRSAEINTYYAEKYREQLGLVKTLIVVGVCVLLIVILNKKDIIPNDISNILLAVVIIVGCYYFGKRVYNYYRRDNMNYQEFDYGHESDYKVTEHPGESESAWDYNMRQFDKIEDQLSGKFCFRDECCSDNMVYNKKIGKCVDKVAGGDAQEPDGHNDNTENFSLF